MASATDITADTDTPRDYLASHSWITFRLDVTKAPWTFWNHVGEARSKCSHLANTPLPPSLAEQMERVYLARGAHATTAIEGNTLSEKQALAAVEGRLQLPRSQRYLRQELENVVHAIAAIEQEIHAGGRLELTLQRLRELNAQVLADLEVDDHVRPGALRTHAVVVGGVYRGAPPQDCEYLVVRMCDWLNGPDFQGDDDGGERDFMLALLKAITAHIYIAWIHPFGDGNGRTARLIEFAILTAAGVPSVAAHLLSNHYNATRSRYYRELDHASKSGGELTRFLDYAAEGFVGELQQQLDELHGWVVQAAWTNYVYEYFGDAHTVTPRRQRDLVLALPSDDYTPRAEVSTLTPHLAQAYANKGPKTVTRDLNALSKAGLIERTPEGVRARRELMMSFVPRTVPGAQRDLDDRRAAGLEGWARDR